MKLALTFENVRTAQHCDVTIDTTRYASAAQFTADFRDTIPSGVVGARLAACDAIYAAIHLLSADRPRDVHLANARAVW